jgi:porin
MSDAWAAWRVVVALVMTAVASAASAQPIDVPPTWGGDLSSRPRLTGSWGGLRDELGKKGVVFDTDLLLTPQDVVSGGRSIGAKLWGNVDYTLNVDTDKLGLWPGGFFKFSADTGFGSNVLANSGAIVPVSTTALLPASNTRNTALMNATFMQFLSPQFGVFAGKINTLDFGKQEFYGDYSTQFQNLAFVTPMTFEQVPFAAFGGGVIALPTEDIIASVLALDASGTPISNDVGHAFKDGAMVVGGGGVTVRPWSLVGHQGLGFSWSDKQRLSLTQDPSNIERFLVTEKFPRLAAPGPALERILARFFPELLVPNQPASRRSDSWSMNYGFDQYLWQPAGDSKHGVGVFFSFGVSDGNPNPIKYAYLAGIGGKGVVPGRDDDSFGLGFARSEFSDDFVRFLRQRLALGLAYEDTIEMYYNFAVTQWLSATPDLQIVLSALKKALGSSGSQLTDIDTTVVAGFRLRARF